MKQYVLNLKALDQLVLTDGSSEGMSHQTLDYIPGNMLLGAFVNLWKQLHKGEQTDGNPEFEDLFLNGTVKWGNACPMVGDRTSVPLPLSFQKIKNYSGLPYYGDEDASNCRVFNLLQLDAEDTIKDSAPAEWGLGKDEVIKPKKLDRTFIDPESFCQTAVSHQWNTHVAMDKRMAAEHQLFGYSSVSAGVKFSSTVICCKEERAAGLKQLLAAADRLRVGHSRSAGYGNVSCELKGEQDFVEQKLSADTNIHNVFLLSHYTPALSWLSPLEGLKEDLKKYFGDDNLEIVENKLSCGYTDVAGFNSMQGLPRRTRRCISAGSIIQVKTSSTSCKSVCALGAFTAEGFGRFEIDPKVLSDKFPRPKPLAMQQDEKTENVKQDPAVNMLVKAVTHRTLSRLAQQKAIEFVSSENMQKFINESPNMMKIGPKASQRGNLRMLLVSKPSSKWREWFDNLLKKDIKLPVVKQWKNSYAKWKGSTANLEVIMKELLNPEFFRTYGIVNVSEIKESCLATNIDSELDYFYEEFQKLSLLELLKQWDKAARKTTEKQSGETK